MADLENHQQPVDDKKRFHDSNEGQQQNIEVNVMIHGNRTGNDECSTNESDRQITSSLSGKGDGDCEAHHDRNIVSRMQNYSDMPNIECKSIMVDSENITIHHAHVKTVDVTSHGSEQNHPDDQQPSSSSSQLDRRQLSTIDSTIYIDPEPEPEPEPESKLEPETEQTPIKEESDYIEETWEHSKARRYRRRAIFCTDSYNNIGDMAREKQFSEALSTMKDRLIRRTKLDRNLSELVSSKEPKFETIKESEKREENNKDELNHRQKKLTMKDVYKELRLMRQVVAACVRVDSSVTKEHPDKSVSRALHSENDKEKKEDHDNSDTATEHTAEMSADDESPHCQSETTSTEENIESNEETENQDSNSIQEQEEIAKIRRLSSMDIGQEDEKQNSDDDSHSNMATEQRNESCTNEENENSVHFDGDEVSCDRKVEENDDDDSDERSTEKSTKETLVLNHQTDVNDKIPSRLSGTIDQSPDEEKYSRKDSISSLDWTSTYSNLNDVVLLVEDFNGRSVVGCVVYTEMDISDPAHCSLVYPADVPSVVNIYENVVSNFLHIVPSEILTGEEDEDEITVAIPFTKDEMYYYQEPVLRVLDSKDRWSDFPCRETLYHRDDDSNLYVLMAKFTGPTTCVVVAMPIVDDIIFTDKMTRFHSTIDSDIILTCPVSARINSKNVHVELKVMPVLPRILEETKMMFDTDRQKLYNAGAIVTLKFFDDHPQTIYMHLPCTRPPVSSRPTTGSKRASSCLGTPDSGYRSMSRGAQISRKGSTFGKFVEPSQEKEYRLVRFASGMATKVKMLTSDDVTVDDQVAFSVHEKSSTSVVLEVTEELPPKVIQDIVPRLLNNIEYQNVQICVAHNKKCLNELALSCDQVTNINSRQMMRLETDNIIRTKAVKLKEGDTLCLCFRGNISSISNHRIIFRYYGVHGIHTAWTIDIVDRYSQRSLSSFCGFLQIFVWKAKLPFDCQRLDVDNKTFWDLVTEMPISLPKPALKLSTKVVRAPVSVRCEGSITPEFLENLAQAIGEGWLRLANSLDIDHPRIQSIKQQHKGKHKELARDILMTWFKRSLFGKEKTSALILALRNSGRDDLADALRESSKRYRREQARNARDNKMETVILSVCKSGHVVSRWKDIASMLDMNDSEIQTINTENTDDVLKCRGMLSLWKQKQNGYGIRKLVKCLKHLGLNHIADHLISMMAKNSS